MNILRGLFFRILLSLHFSTVVAHGIQKENLFSPRNFPEQLINFSLNAVKSKIQILVQIKLYRVPSYFDPNDDDSCGPFFNPQKKKGFIVTRKKKCLFFCLIPSIFYCCIKHFFYHQYFQRKGISFAAAAAVYAVNFFLSFYNTFILLWRELCLFIGFQVPQRQTLVK